MDESGCIYLKSAARQLNEHIRIDTDVHTCEFPILYSMGVSTICQDNCGVVPSVPNYPSDALVDSLMGHNGIRNINMH